MLTPTVKCKQTPLFRHKLLTSPFRKKSNSILATNQILATYFYNAKAAFVSLPRAIMHRYIL